MTVTRYENSLRRDLTRSGENSLRLNPKILSPRRRVLQPQAIHHDFSLKRVPLTWARCFVAQFMGYSPERAPRVQPPHFTISRLGEIPSLERDAQATLGFEFLLFSLGRDWLAWAKLTDILLWSHTPIPIPTQFPSLHIYQAIQNTSRVIWTLFRHILTPIFDIAHNTSYNTDNTSIIFITGYKALSNKHPNNQHTKSQHIGMRIQSKPTYNHGHITLTHTHNLKHENSSPYLVSYA